VDNTTNPSREGKRGLWIVWTVILGGLLLLLSWLFRFPWDYLGY